MQTLANLRNVVSCGPRSAKCQFSSTVENTRISSCQKMMQFSEIFFLTFIHSWISQHHDQGSRGKDKRGRQPRFHGLSWKIEKHTEIILRAVVLVTETDWLKCGLPEKHMLHSDSACASATSIIQLCVDHTKSSHDESWLNRALSLLQYQARNAN